jgi:hypothetical protein
MTAAKLCREKISRIERNCNRIFTLDAVNCEKIDLSVALIPQDIAESGLVGKLAVDFGIRSDDIFPLKLIPHI